MWADTPYKRSSADSWAVVLRACGCRRSRPRPTLGSACGQGRSGYDRGVQRLDVGFSSGEETCAAWLYVPDGAGRVPGVVLAHGWTGVRERRLDVYAERFVFGGARGPGVRLPVLRRQLPGDPRPGLLLRHQAPLADWAAAIAFVRSRAEVDPGRVALWGTSFSGGHVMETAARDRRVTAVVAQVPFADGLRNLPRLGPALAVRLVAAGVRDQFGAVFGRPPHMVPSVGPPGSVAVMTTPDAEPGFRAIDPLGSTWRNEAAARVALRVGSYRPGRHAGRIAAPILFALAEEDAITPTVFAQAAAGRAPNAEVRTYPGGHFDIYVGATFGERSRTKWSSSPVTCCVHSCAPARDGEEGPPPRAGKPDVIAGAPAPGPWRYSTGTGPRSGRPARIAGAGNYRRESLLGPDCSERT